MLVALNAWRTHSIDLERSLERLATGRRINRAADDPSGVVASDTLRASITSAEKIIDRSMREIGLLASRDGSHAAVGDLLVELQGLVVAAANRGALGDGEIDTLQHQADSIIAAIDHLAGTQRFNGQSLLDEAWTHRLGRINVAVKQPDGTTRVEERTLRDLSNAGGLNLRNGNLAAAQESVEAAIGAVAVIRAGIGARTQSLESTIRTSQSELENLSAARSRVMDTDYAIETSNAIRSRTLQQASLFVMKSMQEAGREGVLRLLAAVSPGRGM